MTHIIKAEAIRTAFTEKVNEYLAKGMQFNLWSMSGSQGEKAKVDLTDGTHIYRIRLDRDVEWFEEEKLYDSFDTVVLIVERFVVEERDVGNIFNDFHTLWNGNGEIVESFKWYRIGRRDGNVYTDNREDMLEIVVLRNERRMARRAPRLRDLSIGELDSERRVAIRNIARKHRGYGRTRRDEIARVFVDNYNGHKKVYNICFVPECERKMLRVAL